MLELHDIGVDHVVLNLMKPFRKGLATWAAAEIIDPVNAQLN
ncbi:hypothetical protein [Kribbella alba]